MPIVKLPLKPYERIDFNELCHSVCTTSASVSRKLSNLREVSPDFVNRHVSGNQSRRVFDRLAVAMMLIKVYQGPSMRFMMDVLESFESTGREEQLQSLLHDLYASTKSVHPDAI